MTQVMTSERVGTGAVAGVRTHRYPVGLGLVGLIAVLVSAWGGIVPFLGPTFGFSGDDTGGWYWNLAHALLALAPGALGVLAGLVMMGTGGSTRRLGLSGAGLVAIVCGAWFAIGPLAWPIVLGSHPYFVAAGPLATLEHWIGYALGPGLILAVCGAYSLGWASRADRVGAAAVVPEATGAEQTTVDRTARHAA